MRGPVIIKGNNLGIRLIIAPEATIDEIVEELNLLLHKTGHYYKNIKPINVTFEGKQLTDDDQNVLLETLRKLGLSIAEKTIPKKKPKDNFTYELNDKDGLFYIGNLKNGQSLNTKKSIVIIGDVEHGASVKSEGNIVIIGRLKGDAEAGIKGREDAFVYSYIQGGNINE